MQVVRFKDADSYEPEKGWRRVSLAGSDSASIEYFEKLRGHASPMHKHENRQILIVLKGKMKVCTEDEEVVLGEMDSVCLDENEPHVVENIGEGQSVGIDVFAPGRSFNFWLRRSD